MLSSVTANLFQEGHRHCPDAGTGLASWAWRPARLWRPRIRFRPIKAGGTANLPFWNEKLLRFLLGWSGLRKLLRKTAAGRKGEISVRVALLALALNEIGG